MDLDGAPLTWSLVGRITPSDLGLDDEDRGWLQIPTPVVLDDSVVRVFFATRRNNRPHVRYVDLRIDDGRLTNSTELFPSEPLLEPGEMYWDRDGIYPSSIVRTETGFLLYTIGWLRGAIDPIFTSRIGLAKLDHECKQISYCVEPILDLTLHDPFFVTGPCVRAVEGGFEMLYVSGEAWIASPVGPNSRYSLRRATSIDGLCWSDRGNPALGLSGNYTHIARPSFVQDSQDTILASVTTTESMDYELRICQKSGDQTWSIGAPAITDRELARDAAAYPALVHRTGETLLFVNGIDRGRSGFTVLRSEWQ